MSPVTTALGATAHVLFCLLAAAMLTRRTLPPDVEGAGRGIGAFMLFAAFFFGPMFLLGTIQVVTGTPIVRVDAAAAISGVGALFIALKRPRWPASAGRPSGITTLAWVRELDLESRVLFAAWAGAGILLFGMLCLGFPRGFEPRSYHLPIAAHILQSHGLSAWDAEYMDTFPANASIYYAVGLAVLPERFVAAMNLPILLAFVLSIYALGRALGADPSASVIAACGAATIPIVAYSGLETGADLGGIAFLGAAAYFVLTGSPGRKLPFFYAGLAAGLAFGFKSSHLVSIAVLFVAVLARTVRRNGASARPWKRAVAAVALFAAGVTATAGVWWVRNWLEFGNPLYPVHLGAAFDALGWSRAPDIDYLDRRATQLEWVRSNREWVVYPWVEWQMDGENFKHSSGLGAFYAAMAPAALLAAVAQVCRRRSSQRAEVVLLLAATAAIGGVWWIIGDRQPRYLLGILVYFVPLIAWIIGHSEGRARRVLAGVAAATALIMAGIDFSGAAWNMAGADRAAARCTFYHYPAEVDRLPPGARILNLVGRPENWGLFGASHRNGVINSQRAFRLLDAEARPGAAAVSVRLQARVIRELGATHLVVSDETKLDVPPEIRLVEIGRTPTRRDRAAEVLYRIELPPVGVTPAAGQATGGVGRGRPSRVSSVVRVRSRDARRTPRLASGRSEFRN